jgi:hypothetical protein
MRSRLRSPRGGQNNLPFLSPLAVDPSVSGRVFFGALSVFVSTDHMLSCAQQTTQDLTNGGSGISDVEFAPSDHTRAFSVRTAPTRHQGRVLARMVRNYGRYWRARSSSTLSARLESRGGRLKTRRWARLRNSARWCGVGRRLAGGAGRRRFQSGLCRGRLERRVL